jgi:hypothetical protein
LKYGQRHLGLYDDRLRVDTVDHNSLVEALREQEEVWSDDD